MSLVDGVKYFLGTEQPKAQVVKLNPLKISSDDVFPREFDSRDKWPGYIHEAMDQGQCASSWAFSTAGLCDTPVLTHRLFYPCYVRVSCRQAGLTMWRPSMPSSPLPEHPLMAV